MTVSEKDLKEKFAELSNTLEQALNAVENIGPMAVKKTNARSKDARVSVPPEQIKKVAESIQKAVELGDVIKIKTIAEELKSESDNMAPFCNELVQLAENFDFDGIKKLVIGEET